MERSKIACMGLIVGFEFFVVVSLISRSVWDPFQISSLKLGCLSQIDHLIEFINQAFIIWTNLSHNLITVKTEYKFWFGFNWVMSCNLMWYIAVDFDNLKRSVLWSEFVNVLVSQSAVWVPICSEIYESVWELVDFQIFVKLFEVLERFQVWIKLLKYSSEHLLFLLQIICFKCYYWMNFNILVNLFSKNHKFSKCNNKK